MEKNMKATWKYVGVGQHMEFTIFLGIIQKNDMEICRG